MELVLASTSQRRQQMLPHDLHLSFQILNPEIDEAVLRGEPPPAYVQRLAQDKACTGALKLGFVKEAVRSRGEFCERRLASLANSGQNWAILAADTIVIHGSLVLGKPKIRQTLLRCFVDFLVKPMRF